MDAEELRKKLHPEEEKEKTFKEKVHKYSIAIQIGIAIVVVISILTALAMIQAPKHIQGDPQACFKHDVCIDLIIVTTPEELEIGLSNYSELPENTGMLFIFEKPDIQRMWMKDMDFPIDMFWISSKNRILHIEKKAVPCTPDMSMCEIFEPNVEAKYVLETNEGFARATNLFDNDRVEFRNLPK
jgi:uncharacterized membrane protein (UPF0127 family)